MAKLGEMKLESLPEAVWLSGPWAASKHTLGYPENEVGDQFGAIEYLLVSHRLKEEVPRLVYLTAKAGDPRVWEGRQNSLSISQSRTDLLGTLKSQINPASSIDVGSVYDQMTKSTARTLLTGHYLACYHKRLFDLWSRAGKSKSEFKDATDTYWAPLIDKAGGVTKLTVDIYQELLAWGEASSPSLLSILMNTGPRTVHTRLQEARKQSLLEKPGIGSRKGI